LQHAAKVEQLPFYHRDPFDRLLIAQAMTEKLTIISADRIFQDYGVKVLW
jgi:PIN domain nuclease of toxin-antitoxin system